MSLRRTLSMSTLSLCLTLAAAAGAQEVTMSSSATAIYVGDPFVLEVTAKGFDAEPEPNAPDLGITDCRVDYLGCNPQVTQMIQIINGRQTVRRDVTFQFRYRVISQRAGPHKVPPVTVTQGARTATSPTGTFESKNIPETEDMRLEVVLPARPIWIGESFDVYLDWYLGAGLENGQRDAQFVVPLFDAPAQFSIEAPVKPGARSLALSTSAGELELPYEIQKSELAGRAYTRVRLHARARAQQSGNLSLEPARVLADLKVGVGRDRFGFRAARYERFQSRDRALRMLVRPLPRSGRPASFSGAIGAGYRIEVRADRSVVRVGDPIKLDVRIRGPRLDGLSLPSFTDALSPREFSSPSRSPAGRLEDDGSKSFSLSLRVQSESVSQIPALAFSFFDPEQGRYETVSSRPIALSVQSSKTIGADAVRGAPETLKRAPAPPSVVALAVPAGTAIDGVDLSLSAPAHTLTARPGPSRGLLLSIYALSLTLLAGRAWLRFTAATRGQRARRRERLSRLLQKLSALREAPAKRAAPELLKALSNLEGAQADGDYAALRSSLEALAYAPYSEARPLDPELFAAAERIARRACYVEAASRPPMGLALLAVGLLIAVGSAVSAAEHEELAAARDAYAAAMRNEDRAARVALFSEAEARYGRLAATYPSSPELLADWGAAALGARRLGHAVLAYRRALRLQPDHRRATLNLAAVRAQLPPWLPKRDRLDAFGAFFFWHRALSLGDRQLAAALAFALAASVLAWRGLSAPRWPALLLIGCWIALSSSALVDADGRGELVVCRGSARLRTADSAGAPLALDKPLPAGAELSFVEARDGWIRVTLGSGRSGWLQRDALRPVNEPYPP